MTQREQASQAVLLLDHLNFYEVFVPKVCCKSRLPGHSDSLGIALTGGFSIEFDFRYFYNTFVKLSFGDCN